METGGTCSVRPTLIEAGDTPPYGTCPGAERVSDVRSWERDLLSKGTKLEDAV